MGFSTTLDRKPTTYKVVLLSWVSLAVGLIQFHYPMVSCHGVFCGQMSGAVSLSMRISCERNDKKRYGIDLF